MNRLLIALVCHEVNRAYCASLGDSSVPKWADTSEQDRASKLAGVDMHLANPDTTPDQAHASWLAAKEADGWKFGKVKDIEKKAHPCMVPFEDLPEDMKVKDYLFRGTVHAMAGLPDPSSGAEIKPGCVPIRYIGRRQTYTDRLYGTGLSFVTGQVRGVPEELAPRFLRHADMFEGADVQELTDDDTAALLQQSTLANKAKDKEQDQLQDLRDQVANMTKAALTEFAKNNYRHELDQKAKVADLRTQVKGLIDQFGAV